MGRITQAHIALAAGVSQSVVSQVLKGATERIASSTRHRVLEAAKSLGYQSRQIPVLDDGRTRALGFITKFSREELATSFFAHQLHSGALLCAEARGHHLVFASYTGDALLPDIVTQRKVDGVIVNTLCDPAWLERLQAYVPVVLLNYLADVHVVDTVVQHHCMGVQQALQHLYALGHRRIALFGMEPRGPHFRHREAAYRSMLGHLGLPVCDALISVHEPQQRGSLAEVDDCIERAIATWRAAPAPPTAVLTFNDVFALRLLRIARRHGLAVPEDLSVVGYDDEPYCAHCDPPLTSVNTALDQLGRVAAELLFARIAEPDRAIAVMHVNTRLVVRLSTGPVQRA